MNTIVSELMMKKMTSFEAVGDGKEILTLVSELQKTNPEVKTSFNSNYLGIKKGVAMRKLIVDMTLTDQASAEDLQWIQSALTSTLETSNLTITCREIKA